MSKHTDSVEAIVLEASNRLSKFEHEPAKWHNMMVYEAGDLEGFLDWLRTALREQDNKRVSDLDYDAVEQFEKTNPRSVVQDCLIYFRQLDVSNYLTTLQTTHQQAIEEAVRNVTKESRLYTERRLSIWLEHKPRCYLYNEEGRPEQCDCGLYEALTPNHQD